MDERFLLETNIIKHSYLIKKEDPHGTPPPIDHLYDKLSTRQSCVKVKKHIIRV